MLGVNKMSNHLIFFLTDWIASRMAGMRQYGDKTKILGQAREGLLMFYFKVTRIEPQNQYRIVPAHHV